MTFRKPRPGSRGPRGTSRSSAATAAHSVADQGPLDPGPLGPLDPDRGERPRIDLSGARAALEQRWGADPETGSFACPLPGHSGTALLGVPPDDPDGDLRLLCSCRGRWRSLGEVRAALAYGEDRLRSNIEAAVWLRRLVYEVGCFEPVDVRLPRLPDDAPAWAVAARDGFLLLVGLRWADFEPRPVAFAVRFCAAWCGLASFRAARDAIAYLVEHGVIREAETVNRTRLFLPSRALREVPPPCEEPAEPGAWQDEEALIAALIEAFDAEEVAAEPDHAPAPASYPPPVCAYESHRDRGLDWRLIDGGGLPTCGVCHPPPDREDFAEGVRFVRLAPAADRAGRST